MAAELVVSEALAPMLPGEPPAPGIYVASGPEFLPAWFLRGLGPGLDKGAEVFWIDAGTPIDIYGSSYAARARGTDPNVILRRVLLARAFNLFQLETQVRKKISPLWKGQPVVVSDPMGLYYDEDVPIAEARGVFRRVIAGMKNIPAVWMVLLIDQKPPPGREGLLEDLAAAATSRVRLADSRGRWLLERHGG